MNGSMSAQSSPLISIAIAAYNRAHLIGRTLDSLLQQTVQDFEILISDDASSDASVMPQPTLASSITATSGASASAETAAASSPCAAESSSYLPATTPTSTCPISWSGCWP